jgi:nucleoside-triphosphatase THEP1
MQHESGLRSGDARSLVAPPAIAAVRYSPGDNAEAVLDQAVEQLRRRGVRVAGLLQHSLRESEAERCRIVLENLATGTQFDLSQNLGSGSQACSLDAQVLADATSAIRDALAGDAQLVVINKFGALEAAGGGFRSEILQVVEAGIPLLTSVSHRFLPEWQAFVGELACDLPANSDAILAWWDAWALAHA